MPKHQHATDGRFFMGFDDVCAATSLGPSTVKRMVRASEFPQPVAIGKRRVGWVRAEVVAWCELQVATARAARRPK